MTYRYNRFSSAAAQMSEQELDETLTRTRRIRVSAFHCMNANENGSRAWRIAKADFLWNDAMYRAVLEEFKKRRLDDEYDNRMANKHL